MSEHRAAVGYDELAALKFVALEGGLAGPTKVSCAGLAERLDASTQTASRRLQALEGTGLLARDVVSDGQWVSVTDAGESALRGEYADYRRVFESRARIPLTGRVTGGMGEGRHYISLPGYMRQFRERLGYEPFAGTLNVDLDAESVRLRAGLSAVDAVPIDGWEDDERTFGPASCYAARLSVPADADPDADAATTYEGAHAIVPDRTHHDESQLEVIAPDRLRDALALDDDDRIRVEVVDADVDVEATAVADADGDGDDERPEEVPQ
jgi:riboflavin kinase